MATLCVEREPSYRRNMDDCRLMSSWLLMKKKGLGMSFLKWKRRFAKFEAGVMLLYTDDGPGAELKEKICVLRATVHATSPTVDSGTYTFETRVGGSTHLWAAFSLEERDSWFTVLEDCGAEIRYNEHTTAPSTPSTGELRSSGSTRKLTNFFVEHTPGREWDGVPPQYASPCYDGQVRWAPPFPEASLPGHDRTAFAEVGNSSDGGDTVVKVVLGENFLKQQAASFAEMTTLAISGDTLSSSDTIDADFRNTWSGPQKMVSKGQAAGNQVLAQWLEKGIHLGSGTFGSVYKGTYFNQDVAIKELIVQDLTRQALAEFAHEADLHYHLRHANIVELLCYNVEPSLGPTCMVMELAEGSLYDVLHEGRKLPGSVGDDDVTCELDLDRRLRILDDVACGLLFLHTHGIMHLDLKSLNLLYDAAGRIKLADFGLSVVRSEIEGESGGKPAGSLPYMAPELMDEDTPVPTVRCDVYAFYVVCWEVIVNAMPHAGRSASWIVRFVSSRKKRLVIPKEIFCPERLDHLMSCCAEFDPSNRPTMHVVLLALRDVRADPVEPSLKRVELPDSANFVFEVTGEALKVSNAPSAKLLDSGNNSTNRTLEHGARFFVEAHVVSANARADGEDQVYLKLATNPEEKNASEEAGYVAAFDDTGRSAVKLVHSNLGAERLARDAVSHGATGAVASLLFYLAAQYEEVMSKLLLYTSEKISLETTLSDVVRFKACRRVIAASSVFGESQAVQRAAMLMIVNLSFHMSDAISPALEAGLCETVLFALRKFPKDSELERIAVEAIANLVAKQETAKIFAERQVTGLLVEMVRRLGIDVKSLTKKPRLRERHVAERVWYSLGRVVSVANKHGASSEVLTELQASGATALVVSTALEAVTLATSLEKKGGRRCVFETKQETFDVDLILSSSGAAATKKKPVSPSPEEEENGQGCDSLALTCCDVIHAFATCGKSDNAEVALGLCEPTLFELLRTVLARAMTLQRGIVKLMEDRMKATSREQADELATRACIASMALAGISVKVRAQLADAVLIPMCQLASSASSSKTRLAYYSIGAIHNLCHASPRHSCLAIATGAFASIASCAAASPLDVEQQRLTCRALAILSVCTTETPGFRRDEVLTEEHLAVVPRAMRHFKQDLHLQRDACAAIVNLTAFDTSIASALGRVDACGAVAEALKKFPRDARVQECACRAAVHLAHDEANKKIFDACGVRQHAVAVSTLFSATPAVLQWAERLQREL